MLPAGNSRGRTFGASDFGSIDALKFRSSMTMFASVTSDNAVFTDALQKYFGGDVDSLTVDKL